MSLQTVNLFVGRNGTGKSHALRCIQWLADIISEKNWHSNIREWEATFKDEEGEELVYSFGWADRSIAINHEKLTLNGQLLIERNQETCWVYPLIDGQRKKEQITPPKTKLVINVRRDTKAHPEFEKLIHWAEATYSFRFGTIVPEIASISTKLSEFNFSPVETDKTDYSPGDLFDGLTESQQEQIRQLMQEFGYKIELLKVDGPVNARSLYYTEMGIAGTYDVSVTSQGTYRVLILLIYFLRLLNSPYKPQLLLIDDLGEGLDYSRAYKLGKFIFEECQKAEVQLITTSNDGFIMDAVPIEHWNVLQRNGSEITALNQANQPELFKQFAYTGLSNFDFFSSDYIDLKLK